MNLDDLIAQIRTYASVFSGRVAGTAEFKPLEEAVNMSVPAAYVLRLDDEPGQRMAQNSVEQPLMEGLAVIVALSNTADERGQAAAETVDTIRASLWAALLGWQPTANHRGIEYQGMFLLHRDRSRIWYQFEFGALMYIGPSDGWQEAYLDNLPHFDGMHVNVDVIDPIAHPVPGPDGRIEFQTDTKTLP
jgi:hypothetical protein